MSNVPEKRKIDIVVLSDIHLGTYGCHAKELLTYLRSIKPKKIILNGDIIDIWQFSKSYWPKAHMKVVRHLMKEAQNGTEVIYITGNHDEMLRRFNGLRMGSIRIVNNYRLTLKNGECAWVFHGDVFDVTMQYSKWLARFGGKCYDLLIRLNRVADHVSVHVFKKEKLSISKKIKAGVKKAVAYVGDFEKMAAESGISGGYQYVICGHIHQPQMRKVENLNGSITYLNSGDWIENLTALEYYKGNWSIYHYDNSAHLDTAVAEEEPDNKTLFREMLKEFDDIKIA